MLGDSIIIVIFELILVGFLMGDPMDLHDEGFEQYDKKVQTGEITAYHAHYDKIAVFAMFWTIVNIFKCFLSRATLKTVPFSLSLSIPMFIYAFRAQEASPASGFVWGFIAFMVVAGWMYKAHDEVLKHL